MEIIIVGVVFLIFGAVVFLMAIAKVISMFTVPFKKESDLDKRLFSIWKKSNDYKDFKKGIKKL